MPPKTYWTSPRGILQRARDKANPYKAPDAIKAFNEGWAAAAGETSELVHATNAYGKGWNARVHYERNLSDA